MPAGAPAVSLDAVLAGASPDGAVAAALRSPLFRRRAARWRVLTDEQAAAEEPEEGDGEPALQTMAQYARKRAAEVAAGRMPQNMDDFIVLLLPMQNWEDPKTPVPDTLLSDLKDFAVLFFRGMPIALLAKHNEVQWARNEHDMDALLDGLDRCPWIPSRAKTIIGVTNIEVSGTTAVGEENARQDADEGRGADVAWAYLSSSWCFSDLEAETESGTKKVHRNLCAISSARLGDPKDPDGSMFRRVCKLVVWNICQTLVMDECPAYYCALNRCPEQDDQVPLHLCPVCLAKLHSVCGFDVSELYSELYQYLSSKVEEGYTALRPDAEWYRKQSKFVKDALAKGPGTEGPAAEAAPASAAATAPQKRKRKADAAGEEGAEAPRRRSRAPRIRSQTPVNGVSETEVDSGAALHTGSAAAAEQDAAPAVGSAPAAAEVHGDHAMAEAEPAPPAEEPVDQRMEAVREPPAAQPTEPLLPPAPHPAKALLPPAGQPAKPLLPPPAPHPPKQEDQGEPAPKKRGPRPKKAAEAAGGPAKGPPSASLVDGVPPPNRRGRPPKKPPGGTLPAASGFSSPNPAPLPSLAATAPAPNRIEPHTPDVQQSPANAEPPNSPRVGVKAEDGPSAAYTPVPTLRAASEGPPLVFVSVHLSPSVKLSSAPLREAESPAPRRYFLPPNTTVAEVREKVARKLMERDPNAEFYLELESPVGRGEVMEGQTLHAAVLAAPEVKLWLCQRTPEEVWV